MQQKSIVEIGEKSIVEIGDKGQGASPTVAAAQRQQTDAHNIVAPAGPLSSEIQALLRQVFDAAAKGASSIALDADLVSNLVCKLTGWTAPTSHKFACQDMEGLARALGHTVMRHLDKSNLKKIPIEACALFFSSLSCTNPDWSDVTVDESELLQNLLQLSLLPQATEMFMHVLRILDKAEAFW